MWGIICIILPAPQNIVMHLDDVMNLITYPLGFESGTDSTFPKTIRSNDDSFNLCFILLDVCKYEM